MDFGLRVRSDITSLIVTARNKMRSTESRECAISLSGVYLETPEIYLDKDKNKRNKLAITGFADELIKLGYGGTYYGVIISQKVTWFRDLEYYLFEDDIRKGNTISVISRGNSVFSSSDITQAALFLVNKVADKLMVQENRVRGCSGPAEIAN
jgi:hypothetical protein